MGLEGDIERFLPVVVFPVIQKGQTSPQLGEKLSFQLAGNSGGEGVSEKKKIGGIFYLIERQVVLKQPKPLVQTTLAFLKWFCTQLAQIEMNLQNVLVLLSRHVSPEKKLWLKKFPPLMTVKCGVRRGLILPVCHCGVERRRAPTSKRCRSAQK